MATYKVLERCYAKRSPDAAFAEIIDGPSTDMMGKTQFETIIMRDDEIPGPHLQPLDKAAKAAFELYEQRGAPLNREAVRQINLGLIEVKGAYYDPAQAAVEGGNLELYQQLAKIFGPLLNQGVDISQHARA